MTWSTILYLVLTTAAFLTGLVIVNIRPVPGIINFWDLIGVGTMQFFVGFAAIVPAFMYGSARVNDELLDLPIPPRERLHGYMFLSFLLAGYFAVLSLPFVALAFVFGGNLGTMLFSLVSTLLGGIVSHLLFLSFLNKVGSQTGLIAGGILLFFFGSMPFALLGMTEGLITVYSSFSRMRAGGPPPMVNTNNPFFIAYIAFFYLVIGIIAYRLCRNHFSKPFRNVWMELGINVLAYGVATFVCCALWAGVRLSGVVS